MRAAAALSAFFLLLPVGAAAHPLDEVMQGAYLTLTPGKVRLALELTPGPLVMTDLLRGLDPDGNGRITDSEAHAYAVSVLRQTSISFGEILRWEPGRIVVPPYRQLIQGGTVTIEAAARRPERGGASVLAFDNRYRPAKSRYMANIFIRPGGVLRYRVVGQQHGDAGRRLVVSFFGAA